MNEQYKEIYEKLIRLQWLLHRGHIRSYMDKGPMADSSRGQGRVLAMLKLQPEISTKDLSYLLGIRQQSLNELINKLEKGGYVTRTPSEADRRIMMVQLTEKGKAEQIEESKPREDVFSCLSEEEQAAFSGFLDRLIAALEEALGDGDDDETCRRMNDIRAQVGDEQFERLMAMRGRMPRGFGGGHGDMGRGGRFENHRGHGHEGHGPWEGRERQACPEDCDGSPGCCETPGRGHRRNGPPDSRGHHQNGHGHDRGRD